MTIKSGTDVSTISGSCWDKGEHYEDLTVELSDARGLFGREREVTLLREAFQQVCSRKCSSTVVVHGESGVGKTSLVDSLRSPVVENRGYFCAGKFFQNSAFSEPYSAIMAAFSDVCDVVTQSEDFDEERRSKIQQTLGNDGNLLKMAISNITPFLRSSGDSIGDDSEGILDVVSNECAHSKFKVACKTFLQAVSTDAHPLVLFIDDIQWMDVGSCQLIELFMNDKDLKNVLLILAYRDEEAETAVHSFRDKHEWIDIALKCLDASAISDIVSSITGETSDEMQELSQLIQERAQGNPFHVQAFLEMIQTDNLITFEPESNSWRVDVDMIRSSTTILGDLADILARKIDLVHADIKQTLKVAAVMGYRFSEIVLAETVLSLQTHSSFHLSQNLTTTEERLSECIKIGFIEKIKVGYQFTHDKIQTAFQEMIRDDEETQTIHRIIGEKIQSCGTPDELSTIYHAAVHLNSAPSAITSDKERLHMMEVNLAASKYCMTKSAFVAASDLLHHALSHLTPSELWSDKYFDLTFEMTELFAKAELIIGNFDSCKEATREAIAHAKSTEMKLNSLLMDVEVRLANHYETGDLVVCAYRALEAVGVRMPSPVSTRHVLGKFFRVRRLARKNMRRVSVGVDKSTATAVEMLATLCQACLLLGEKEIALYSALKAVELTLNHGFSPSSPIALVIFGVVHLSMGKYNKAYDLSTLAMQLLNNPGYKSSRCRTVAMTVSLVFWQQESWTVLRQRLADAATIGFEVGDIVGATYCVGQAEMFDVLMGQSLHKVEETLRYSWNRIAELDQDGMLQWLKPILQFILNLQGRPSNWERVSVLSGDVMDEDKYLLEAIESKHITQAVSVLSLKAFLACAFRDFEEGAQCCDDIPLLGSRVKFSYARLHWLFCVVFSNLELYRDSRNKKHLRKARRSKKELVKFLSRGCPEAAPIVAFVGAVELTLQRNIDHQELIDAFNDAIRGLAEKENHGLGALLNEYAGFDLAKRGHLTAAKSYFTRALDIYQNQWCSSAKYQWLLERSAKYTLDSRDEVTPTRVGSVIVCDKD